MQGSISKMRNVYGESRKEKFEDVKPHDTTTEGSLIDANTHFVAVIFPLYLVILVHGRRRLCFCVRRAQHHKTGNFDAVDPRPHRTSPGRQIFAFQNQFVGNCERR